jgi:hypothetical protein
MTVAFSKQFDFGSGEALFFVAGASDVGQEMS